MEILWIIRKLDPYIQTTGAIEMRGCKTASNLLKIGIEASHMTNEKHEVLTYLVLHGIFLKKVESPHTN